MVQQISPFIEAKYGWGYGADNWDPGMDENLLKFSFMFDGRVDGVVASLPAAINGQSYFLTTDNRFYFAVGTTWYSSPCPQYFVFKIKGTGDYYQYDGSNAVQIDSPAQAESRFTAIEATLSSLGTAAFEDVADLATQAELDVVSAQANAYTDTLRDDLADDTNPAKGAAIVGRSSVTVYSLAEMAALPTNRKLSASLSLGGRSGHFFFNSSDLSAEVSADTLQGIYIATSFDPTGASGAWVRQFGQSVSGMPEVSPAWWGSDPALPDNTAAFQAALDTGLNVKDTRDGVFATGGLLMSTAGQRFEGSVTLKKIANTNIQHIRVFADNCSVRGLTLDGTEPQSGSTNANDSIRIGTFETGGFDGVEIRNCTVIGGKGGGIMAYRSSNCKIMFNTTRNTGTNGIFFGGGGSDDNQIIGNTVDGTAGQNGIFITASPDSSPTAEFIYGNIISGNTVRNCADTCIESGIHAVGTRIFGNVTENSPNPGILVRDGLRVSVTGNDVISGASSLSTWDGIAFVRQTEPSTWAYDSNVSSNTILRNHGRNGIYIIGSDVSVTNNTITDNLRVPAADGSGLTGFGIALGIEAGGAKGIVIRGNDVSRVSTGINMNFANLAGAILTNSVVDNNTVRETSTGISLFRCDMSRCSVSRNSIFTVALKGFATASMIGNNTTAWIDNIVMPEGFTVVGGIGDLPPVDVYRGDDRAYVANITPASVAAGATSSQNFTVTGVTVRDTVSANPPTGLAAGLIIASVRVSAANTVTIGFVNVSGGAIVPPAGEWKFSALVR
tara:strand:- start:49667 stop:52018 length:2352 start_codon:yes stop_codon:yes gene_type:complete